MIVVAILFLSRVNGAVSDQHTADGMSHRYCCKSFMNHRSIITAHLNATQVDDDAFRVLVGKRTVYKTHVYYSVEIKGRYVSYG